MGTTISSIWASYSTATLSDAEKALVRGYCGYQSYGNGASGFLPWQFSPQYLTLEFQMNNRRPEEYQEIRGRVTEIQILDQAIPGAGANLDTDAASVWTHNKNEVSERAALMRMRCLKLCQILAIDPGEGLAASGHTLSLVV
jgi:hypothetical protein